MIKKKPFQQGHLDSTCGIYAIINAFHYIYDLNLNQLETLHKIVNSYANDHAQNIITTGMTTNDLYYVLEETNKIYPYGSLSLSRPYLKSRPKNISVFIDKLQNKIKNKKACAIIGIGHPHRHWSIIDDVTEKSISLFDSDGLTRFHQRSLNLCTMMDFYHGSIKTNGVWLHHRDLIFVEKM